MELGLRVRIAVIHTGEYVTEDGKWIWTSMKTTSVVVHYQIKQAEANVLKTVEKRSLLPWMIYLSIYSAPSAVKENIESNGSSFDPKLSLELKILLERYAKILEFTFHDAVELVLGVSRCQKPLEALSPDLVDWMNFAVFLNAWNLNSHEIVVSDRDSSSSGTWHLVSSLMRKYVIEKIRSAGSLISSPGSDFPILVQLVTEPLAWHGLIIQSCVRLLFPTGKKKKKGPAEQLNSHLFREIQNSIQSVCEIIEIVAQWLSEQIDRSDDEKFEAVFSSLRRDGSSNGPGKVFQILESSISVMKDVGLGERISEALHSWNPAHITRKIIIGQGTLLSEFLKICKLKIKSLQALKLHL